MDPQTLDTINLVFLLAFVILVFLGVLRMAKRYFSYRKNNMSVPKLLIRDFLLFFGLGFPFLGGLIFRATNIIAREEGWYPVWVIVTGSMAIYGVAYFVWYEYFKIEK
jgi:hypothetical protein